MTDSRQREIEKRLAARKAAGKPQPMSDYDRARAKAMRQAKWIIPLALGGPIVLVVAFVVIGRCTTRTPEPRPRAVAVPPRTPTVEERVADAPSLREAIEIAKPVTSRRLAPYAAAKLRWVDVDASETTLGKVEKDAEAELGKRLCLDGTLDRIERESLGARKIFLGELTTTAGDHVAFLAVGSSGELVKRDAAKLCGIVTGKSELLGMFDLPENRTPIVEH